MTASVNVATDGVMPALNDKQEDRVFSRETSAEEDCNEKHILQQLTKDSLDSWTSMLSDKESEDQKTALSSSESESDSQTNKGDALLSAISGIWWGSAGERYNVEKTARGFWRCVRRGPKLGQQKAYSLHCEMETGSVIWANSFALDSSSTKEGRVTWRSLKAMAGGKRRRFSWSREQPCNTKVVVPADEPAMESEPEVLENDREYSRSCMLQVRLKMLEAQVDEKALGICMKRKQPAVPAVEAPVESGENSTSQLTTVMLRNLPNQCTRGMLVKWLCTTEFHMDFDLVYVPVDRTSGNNLGYCFINFMEAATCQRFISAIHGTKAAKCFPGSRSGKVLHVCYAKVQGKEPYCQGLANAGKLSATGDDCQWDESLLAISAAMTAELAVEPTGSSVSSRGLRASAPDFVPTMSALCQEKTTESTSSSASPCNGLRADAPDFVPQAMGTVLLSTDEFLEALTGKSIRDLAQSHQQAAARAKRFSTQLFVPPAVAGTTEAAPAGRGAKAASRICVPAKQAAAEASAQAREELWW